MKNKHQLRSEDVHDWLRKRGYDVPTSEQPVDKWRPRPGGSSGSKSSRKSPRPPTGPPYPKNYDYFGMWTGIYRIFHKDTSKCYIGQSANIYVRMQQHYTPKGAERFGLNKREMRENMKWEILEECDKESLVEREKHWIEKFNSKKPNGYN